MTWGALNIVGGGETAIAELEVARKAIYAAANERVAEWGIEHNELGWRADAFLYCAEALDPESGWRVPLAPSWVIGEKTKTVALLVPDEASRSYRIEIESGASDEEMKRAKASGTVGGASLIPPNGGPSTPIKVIRNDARGGLRLWENDDLMPRPDDVFQERLYCIRWVETYTDAKGKQRSRKHYCAPTQADLGREAKVLELLRERFADWQRQGFIPRRRIEPGQKTDEPIRTRGWTHWHHLFTPRQLLINGLLAEILEQQESKLGRVGGLLGTGRVADWSSRLSRWHSNAANEKVEQVFSNQALNTLFSFGSRTLSSLETTWFAELTNGPIIGSSQVILSDARAIQTTCDLWITDPPYADAVNYEEISEFFLAWYEGHIPRLFPEWYADSKRALAVKGNDEHFKLSMVDCYKRLAAHMSDNGMQVVMFTHQDASVWADLTTILWAAGLRVTAAWCISTETDSALKQGNYVQGTVLMVLRKRQSSNTVFLDEILPRIEDEVKHQLNHMTRLEDDSNPNFSDSDYQLAAYAAALRVLTEAPIAEINPERELRRVRTRNERSPVEDVIDQAVRIAADHLVPKGFDADVWRLVGPLERYYLKAIEVETHGENRAGAYQELARGFGAPEYDSLYWSSKANEARLMTASEMGKKFLNANGFGESLVRHALRAISRAVEDQTPQAGLNYLKTELRDYWTQRQKLMVLLEWFARLGLSLAHWRQDSEAARLVTGSLRNDHA